MTVPPSEEFAGAVVVEDRELDGSDVVVLRLRRADGGDFPSWEPGAHIDVELTPQLVRQYSLCGDTADRRSWQIAVGKQPPGLGRGGSAVIHEGVQAGSQLRIFGPRNNFPLEQAERYLFIAGGVGITPILPMVEHLAAQGSDWHLVFGGRSLATMAFTTRLSAYGDRVEFCPQDEVGLLDLDAILGSSRPGTHVYCCGPEPLIDAVVQRWHDPSALHVERFAPQTNPGGQDNLPFEIHLDRLGTTLEVPPDKSILEVLEENGVTTLSSCRSGICGTCETAVLDGKPEHRDSVLSAEEQAANEYMMICVSRSRGPSLRLDI